MRGSSGLHGVAEQSVMVVRDTGELDALTFNRLDGLAMQP